MKKKIIEKDKKNKRKRWLIIIGSLIFVIGIVITTYDLISPYIDKKNEDKSLEVFYQLEDEIIENKNETSSKESKVEEKPKVKYNYIAALKISKINLEKGLFSKTDKYNNVNFGLEILKESDSPDVINGNVIIAGHSGTANISYFRNLHKLNNGDQAIIIYGGKTYNYKLVNSYEITKNGKAKIVRNNKKSTMTLITCKHNTDKQVVFIFEQEDGE
mgnify:CR=1 FL=1